MNNAEKIIEIDILKCGILLIILCHLPFFLSFKLSHYPAAFFTHIGLAMFIFATGYTISNRYPILKTKDEVAQYFKKRIVRIYPIWWIGVLLWFIFFGIFNINPNPYTENFRGFGGMGLIYLVAGVHGFFKADGGNLEWYVGTILFYYVIYAIIAKYARDDVDIFIISLGIYIICYLYQILNPRFYLFYPVFLISIFAGKYNFLNITAPYFSRIPKSVQGIIQFISYSSYATYMIHPVLLSLVKLCNEKLKIVG